MAPHCMLFQGDVVVSLIVVCVWLPAIIWPSVLYIILHRLMRCRVKGMCVCVCVYRLAYN